MRLSGFDRVLLLVDLVRCRRFHEAKETAGVLGWLAEELAGLALEAELEPDAAARDRMHTQLAKFRAGVVAVVGPLPYLPEPGRVERLRRATRIHLVRASTMARRWWAKARERVERFHDEITAFFVRGGLV